MDLEFKYFIKGSGTSASLLTGNLDDQENFIPLNLSFKPKILKLSGLYAMAVSEDGELFIWGTMDKLIMEIPKSILGGIKINKISCGWDHSLFSSD